MVRRSRRQRGPASLDEDRSVVAPEPVELRLARRLELGSSLASAARDRKLQGAGSWHTLSVGMGRRLGSPLAFACTREDHAGRSGCGS